MALRDMNVIALAAKSDPLRVSRRPGLERLKNMGYGLDGRLSVLSEELGGIQITCEPFWQADTSLGGLSLQFGLSQLPGILALHLGCDGIGWFLRR
ncbi:hypothetical protein QQM39_27285 [Streptomyces sp. DT2A-34]|uniref:hypothetical protein n=1 Tax=Streptomyces sp. DT2A-34 TaxID=3051182 RepID=UPI00265B8344|nr:hypothetical protein [Streptomyces sp. DT2A-34]MDO0914401.1 hypothetical protein [Streptomyces sp. DT2A-34]